MAGSTVTGNVSASGQIQGSGTVTGTKTPGAAALPLPAPFDEATARGLADRIVEGNATYDTDQVIDAPVTLYDAVENGISFLTIVSLGVLVLFAVGILGALSQPPKD